jgi:Glycine rich protein
MTSAAAALERIARRALNDQGSTRSGPGPVAAGRFRRVARVGAGTAVALAFAAAPAQAATASFSSTGAEQVFSVPAGVTSLAVTAIGAAGSAVGGAAGGRGATLSGTIAVTPGQMLYVEVGDSGSGSAGGFNGGGNPGGGGASDVRTVPRAVGLMPSLQSRLIIAGAGGGGYQNAGGDAGTAGGGALGGGAGTATAGGIGGDPGAPGGLGNGGDGGAAIGGGGGGGLFGGGGGGVSFVVSPPSIGGGGGGSSLVPSGGTQSLAPLTTPARIDITYTPVPPPVPTFAIFTGSPKSLRVSKSGHFTYRLIATPGRSGKAKLASTRKIRVASKRRTFHVGPRSFTAPATGQVKLSFKLSRVELKALKHRTSLQFKLSVTIAGKTFTAKVTLKPPKHKRVS